MPLLDRFWQARIALAAFLAFVAVAFAVRFLPIAYVVDQRRHIAFWPDALFTLAFCVALLVLAVYFARSVQTARERVAWREAILSDVLDVDDPVSEQESKTHRALAHNVRLPLTLVWREPWYTRATGVLSYSISAMCAFVAGYLFYRTIAALIQYDITFYYAFADLGSSFAVFFVTMAPLFCAYFFFCGGWECWHPTVVMTVSDTGVTQRIGLGKRFIRWGDMWLLEFVTYVTFSGRRFERKQRYILYSRDAAIAWNDVYSRQARYSQREEMLASIEQRGGLRPRQFKRNR